MKRNIKTIHGQPETFSPGITKGMVREHALKLFPGKIQHHALTIEDWVFAEKDLVLTMESDGLLKR